MYLVFKSRTLQRPFLVKINIYFVVFIFKIIVELNGFIRVEYKRVREKVIIVINSNSEHVHLQLVAK